MKPKILTFCLDKRDTTAFWRGTFHAYINHKDFEIKDISDNKIFDWTTFLGYSILWIQRPFGREHTQVITAAKNMGLKIILDYDDDLTCVDMYNPTYELYKSNQANLQTCLQLADEIWTSTESIKQSYLPFNKNIHVIPNAHNNYIFNIKLKRLFSPNKTVYYRGGGSHQADVMQVADTLVKVINNSPEWTFMFQGDRFTYIEQRTGDNHHIIPPMTILEFFRYLNETNPCAMIFPLCDTIFNRGKSNISWLEASYSGAAFFGNTRLPEFNKEFILPIEAFGNEWDMPLLERMNHESWEYICDELLLSNINKLRVNRILENL
jgi:hypothetical protein